MKYYSIFTQLFNLEYRSFECVANRIRTLSTSRFKSRPFSFSFYNMSTLSSSSSSSSETQCRLVCLQHSHDGVPLPDGVAVNVGRSPATKIMDPRCSRNQVAITSSWSEQKVRVQQLGSNPSSVDGKEIGMKKEVVVGEDATIFILSGQYPHKVVFTGTKAKDDQHTTKDKKTKDIKKATSTNNHSSSSSSGITEEIEDVKVMKASVKRQSSSENGHPDAKRKKHDDVPSSEGNKKVNKRDSSSLKDHHKDKKTSRESERKIKKDKKDDSDSNDDDAHMKVVASRLEAMKKDVAKDKKSESSRVKDHSKEQSKSLPSSSTLNHFKKSSSSSSSSSTSSSVKENTWNQHEHLYVFTSKGVENRNKIAGFDVDGTIILTKSGKTFPVDSSDWRIAFPEIFGKLKQLHKEGFKIVFFTNQLGVARGKIKLEDLKTKLENIVSKLQVPVQVFVATHEGKYRKPVEGMWKKLNSQYNCGISIDAASCIYVGDAAGRPVDWEPKKKKDFSSSDRLFALNIGVDFKTPEEFFLQHKKAPFTMPKFDPRKVSSSTPLLSPGSQLTLDEKELIVMVGYPASGKSHFSKHNLKPKGFAVVNRDTLGSWQKCVKVTNESLVNSSVVVDNTNLTPEERKRYIDCAKVAGVPCRCFLMTTTFEHSRHNEKFREMTDSSHAKINEMIFNQARSKFKEPQMSEGFSEIVKVNFVPKFSSSSSAAEYKKFILEK